MNHSHSLYIIRGLPGTGKTELAETFRLGLEALDPLDRAYMYDINHHLYAEARRGDVNGSMLLDTQKVKSVYEATQTLIGYKMHSGCRSIILVGSFLKRKQLEPYYAMAAQYRYSLSIITAHNFHANPNKIPHYSLRRMSEALEFPDTVIPVDLQAA